jgi:natural product precursor
MKKVNLKGKLSLGKETITKLNNEQMSLLMGGSGGPPTNSCINTQACYPTCFVSQGTTACCQ